MLVWFKMLCRVLFHTVSVPSWLKPYGGSWWHSHTSCLHDIILGMFRWKVSYFLSLELGKKRKLSNFILLPLERLDKATWEEVERLTQFTLSGMPNYKDNHIIDLLCHDCWITYFMRGNCPLLILKDSFESLTACIILNSYGCFGNHFVNIGLQPYPWKSKTILNLRAGHQAKEYIFLTSRYSFCSFLTVTY